MSDKEKQRAYTEAEVQERLDRELPDWYLENGWIRRYYKTDGWQATMMLVNTIGYLAEAAYHHPDLTVSWAKVWVKLQNHQAGGITDKDFRTGQEDRGDGAVAARSQLTPGPRHAQQVGAQRRETQVVL